MHSNQSSPNSFEIVSSRSRSSLEIIALEEQQVHQQPKITMPASIRKYKAAAVQSEPGWFDLEKSVQKTIDLINEAGQKGCKLIAFPETCEYICTRICSEDMTNSMKGSRDILIGNGVSTSRTHYHFSRHTTKTVFVRNRKKWTASAKQLARIKSTFLWGTLKLMGIPSTWPRSSLLPLAM